MDNNIIDKRTPGKWEAIEYRSILEPVTINSGDKEIAVLHWGIRSKFPETIKEVHSNAAFIVKACNNYDSLLEALKELVNDHEHHYAISFVDEAIISRAKEAIKKATI